MKFEENSYYYMNNLLCLPLNFLSFFFPGFNTNKSVHWKSLIDDNDGDLEVVRSLFSEFCILLTFWFVGEPSLQAAAIFLLTSKQNNSRFYANNQMRPVMLPSVFNFVFSTVNMRICLKISIAARIVHNFKTYTTNFC